MAAVANGAEKCPRDVSVGRGSTLVVLVERQVGLDDADGIPDRALDWYDIGELGLGR